MLSKPPTFEFFPEIPGRAYQPASRYCTPNSQTGSWVYSCRRVDFNWRSGNSGIRIPPNGQVIYVTNDAGKITDAYFLICTSTWVPNPGAPLPPTCYDYPEVPAIQHVPARFEETPVADWNAGAHSVKELDGDCAVRFNIPQAVGVIVGFATNRALLPERERIHHGLYFHLTAAGRRRVSVIERGRALSQQYEYDADDRMEIHRVGTTVHYYRGEDLLYTSARPSIGTLFVASSVYASGDLIE